jgi:hypothetical protein
MSNVNDINICQRTVHMSSLEAQAEDGATGAISYPDRTINKRGLIDFDEIHMLYKSALCEFTSCTMFVFVHCRYKSLSLFLHFMRLVLCSCSINAKFRNVEGHTALQRREG